MVGPTDDQLWTSGGDELTSVGSAFPTIVGGDGIYAEEIHMLRRLWNVWVTRWSNNRKRMQYRLGKNIAENLGLAFKNADDIAMKIRPVCGWPAKAVEDLCDLSKLDYFTFPDNGDDDDLKAAWRDNDGAMLYDMAADSQTSCGIMHWTVTKGGDGEQAVVVNAYSALNSASVWDRRHKRIAYGMVVVDADTEGVPTEIHLHTPDEVLVMRRLAPENVWTSQRKAHTMGRPLMEPMPYRPTLDRPLGRSRITSAVMSITDNAVREVMRSEVAAEVFTKPKRAYLGLKASQMPKDPKTYWNAVDVLPLTESGQNPQAIQLSPTGMQDHILYMRQLAAQFAGETRLPLSSLGVVSDNPSSAEAIYAAKEGLIQEAERMNETNAAHLENVARLVMATAENVPYDALDDAKKGVRAHFKHPDRQSSAAMADAALKKAQAVPELAHSKVILRDMGYDEGEIEQIQSDIRRYKGQQVLAAVAGNAQSVQSPYQTPQVAHQEEQEDEAQAQQAAQPPSNEGGNAFMLNR